MEVIWEKGYYDTSINDIVKAAGIPKGSFYYYFETKEEFAIQALESYVDMIDDDICENVDKLSGTPVEKLWQLLDYRIQQVTNKGDNYSNGCFLFNMCTEMSKHSDKIKQSVAQLLYQKRTDFINLLNQGIEEGEINYTNAEHLAEFLEYSFNGAFSVYQATDDLSVFDRFKGIVKNLLLSKP